MIEPIADHPEYTRITTIYTRPAPSLALPQTYESWMNAKRVRAKIIAGKEWKKKLSNCDNNN